MSQPFDAIVIGEGIAGMSAAQRLARGGRRVAIFEGQVFGGLVLNINALSPAPRDAGDTAPMSGAEYGATLMQTNVELGVERVEEAVERIEPAGDAVAVTTGSGTYRAAAVIVATGARLRSLDVPGEQDFTGRGVSHCADCDGPMFAGQDVVVVGGGDSALQSALTLSEFCRRVDVVCRDASLGARASFVEEARSRPNIHVAVGRQVQRIEGGAALERVVLREAGGAESVVSCAGLFPFIGLVPNSEFLPPAVARGPDGLVQVDDQLRTTMPRVWAIGAVRRGHDGLLSGAVSDAERVARAVSATRMQHQTSASP